MSTQPATIASIPVALSEANCFFETNLWTKFRESNRSHEEILSSIGMEARGGFVHMAREAARSGNQEARQRVIEYDIEDDLLARFKARLVYGQLIATGFYAGSSQRSPIAPELWTELHPDFINNKASSKTHSFTRVEVALSSNRHPLSLSILVSWLQEQALLGESHKETLLDAAYAKFGRSFAVRLFNEAYATVFQRVRGRPRR